MNTKKLIKLLILCQIFDGVFTYWGVQCLGMGLDIEGNPIMRLIIQTLGAFWGLFIVKSLCILALLNCIRLKYVDPLPFKIALVILVTIYTCVVSSWAYEFINNIWSFQCI